jgi:hypothetical protein
MGKKDRLVVLAACLVISGYLITILDESAAMEKTDEVHQVQVVRPRQDPLLFSVDKSDRVYTRLESVQLKTVSFFHQRKIGKAIVEKDFIRYRFNTETGELVEKTKKWRADLPDEMTPSITKEQAESIVKGKVTSSQLYIISPQSDIFPIKPTPENPCWIVRSSDNGRPIVTVIDAMTGKKLGYGISPP